MACYQLEFGLGGQRGAVIPLPKQAGEIMFVGRGPQFLIANKNVSRKQISLSILPNDRADKNGCMYFAQVTRVGVNPSVLVRKSSQLEIYMIKDKSYNLKLGDTIFLIPTQYPMTLGLNEPSILPPIATNRRKPPVQTPDSDKENRPPIHNNIKPQFATPQPIRKASIPDFFSPSTKRKQPPTPTVDSPITKKVSKSVNSIHQFKLPLGAKAFSSLQRSLARED